MFHKNISSKNWIGTCALKLEHRLREIEFNHSTYQSWRRSAQSALPNAKPVHNRIYDNSTNKPIQINSIQRLNLREMWSNNSSFLSCFIFSFIPAIAPSSTASRTLSLHCPISFNRWVMEMTLGSFIRSRKIKNAMNCPGIRVTKTSYGQARTQVHLHI